MVIQKPRWIPYLQLLGGVADPNQKGLNETGAAIAPGAGLEYVVRGGWFGFGVRGFADYVIAFKGGSYPRASIGIVVRVHEE
jgi:hypothetical protein